MDRRDAWTPIPLKTIWQAARKRSGPISPRLEWVDKDAFGSTCQQPFRVGLAIGSSSLRRSPQVPSTPNINRLAVEHAAKRAAQLVERLNALAILLPIWLASSAAAFN